MGRVWGLAFALAAGVATAAAAAPASAPPSTAPPSTAPPPGAPAAVPRTPGPVATLPTPAPEAGRPGREPRVFISPSGEPFRPGPGDADPLTAWFEQVDVGHKGYFDRADFRADATRFFQKLDENGDKVIDGFEVADYEAKIAPELAQWANGDFPGEFGQARNQRQGGGEGRRRGERGGEGAQQEGAQPQGSQGGAQRRERGAQRGVYQLINEPEPVSDADFDLDGHITFDEWMRATDRRFTILDANKDGRVTLEELRARFLPIRK
jgi:hypothetical protein